MLETILDQTTVISYFDLHAATWDGHHTKTHSPQLDTIFNFAQIEAGCHVLDVACGTGVLFPGYCARGVASITGVDISPRMIAQAKTQHHDSRIRLINRDIEQVVFDRQFDRVMVFNALPHFPSPQGLVECLAKATEKDGRLTIAHDIGRERLNALHCTKARNVSKELITIEELISYFKPFYEVDVAVSNENMYVVSGIRR